jgi:hypothetical protein
MSGSYSFTKTVNKIYAFDPYMKDYPVPFYDGVSVPGDGTIAISTTQVLTTEEEATLTTAVAEYSDPEVFLVYHHTESFPARSRSIFSTTPEMANTVIYPNQFGQELVYNAAKTILEYRTDHVENFLNETGGYVTFTLYDCTRNFELATQVIGIDDLVLGWAAQAANNETGPSTSTFRSVMFNDLMNAGPDYDCIWHFKLSVSNTNISVRMNGLQYIVYSVM